MQRKRLQNAANELCQMFCGWQLRFDKPALSRLGSGILTIDAISAACQFNGQPIETLSIAKALQTWLSEELARLGLAADAIKRAHLEAVLDLSKIAWSDRSSNEQWFRDGKQVVWENLYRCEIRCTSEVATDEIIYHGTRSDLEEWPSEWPAA
jgi:hypothetical protein